MFFDGLYMLNDHVTVECISFGDWKFCNSIALPCFYSGGVFFFINC